jgi:hypothetical protein
MIPIEGTEPMAVVTAAALFLVFVAAIGTVVVKVYEWCQDVLHGPYIGRSSQLNQYRDRL